MRKTKKEKAESEERQAKAKAKAQALLADAASILSGKTEGGVIIAVLAADGESVHYARYGFGRLQTAETLAGILNKELGR